MKLVNAEPEYRLVVRNGIISVEFDEDNKRVRKVVSRSNARVTGKWPSWKLELMAYYDSINERNAFKLLDVWPAVRSYLEQPCTIRYWIDGEAHRHVPDIMVDFGTHKELWEVKTEADAKQPDVVCRTALMTECLPAFGYRYRLVIAEHLRQEPRLSNIDYMLRHGREPVPLVEREMIRQIFGQTGSVCWGFFQPGEDGAVYRRHVCRMVLEGVLSIDINLPWDSSTAVLWNKGRKGETSWL